MSIWVKLGTSRSSVGLAVAAIALVSSCAMPASAQCELDKMLPPDRMEDEWFGYSVAVDETYLVVGAPRDSAAYLFELVDSEAVLVRTLVPDDGVVGDQFGWAVDMEGDLIVVGADEAEQEGVVIGGVYIYHRDAGDGWGQVAKLVPSDDQVFRFGQALAISGDTVVGGAPASVPEGGRENSGTAHIFQHAPGDPTTWLEVAALHTPHANEVDNDFGAAVDIDGDTVIVGDHREAMGGLTQAGAAYIFERHHGGEDMWGEVTKLVAEDASFAAGYGASVSIHGNTAIIGSPRDDNIFWAESGSVYLVERDQGGPDNWGELQKIIVADIKSASGLGRSVTIYGDTALVGACDTPDSLGSVFVLRRPAAAVGEWTIAERLFASDAMAGDEFGFSVALDTDFAIMGAVRDDKKFEDSGSAYVFDVRLGDIDGDCLVGPHDLILMLGAWGDCPAPENCHNCHMDLDGDCTVGTLDLIILLGNWG